MTTARFVTPRKSRGRTGFTLVEMLVVMAIISILAALLLPSLARAKAKAHQTKCLSNLRQLAMANTMYAQDYNDEFPPRFGQPNAWPQKLQPFYQNWEIITCPKDRFGVVGYFADESNPNRSFLFNGFNDYFMQALSDENYQLHKHWQWPHGMQESKIPQPSETILFGEKRSASVHVHMDIDQGNVGNDYEEIDHQRHGRGSNYAFADVSVRLLRREQELYPENRWAVTDAFRFPPNQPH